MLEEVNVINNNKKNTHLLDRLKSDLLALSENLVDCTAILDGTYGGLRDDALRCGCEIMLLEWNQRLC